MIQEDVISKDQVLKVIRIIFYLCAFYFFMMGFSLIFLPHFLIRGLTGSEINPAVIGMLRGAGGSIIPYSVLYVLIALNPYKREWALVFVLLANLLAISLDIASLLLEEYRFSSAMIDIPAEAVSICCIIIIWLKMKIRILRPK